MTFPHPRRKEYLTDIKGREVWASRLGVRSRRVGRAKDGLCRWEYVRAPGRIGKGDGSTLNMATCSDNGVCTVWMVNAERMRSNVRNGEGSKEELDGA